MKGLNSGLVRRWGPTVKRIALYSESQKALRDLIEDKGLSSSIEFTKMKPRDKFDTITKWEIHPRKDHCSNGLSGFGQDQPYPCPNCIDKPLRVANYDIILGSGTDEQSLSDFLKSLNI